jgi:hypothetical protein
VSAPALVEQIVIPVDEVYRGVVPAPRGDVEEEVRLRHVAGLEDDDEVVLVAFDGVASQRRLAADRGPVGERLAFQSCLRGPGVAAADDDDVDADPDSGLAYTVAFGAQFAGVGPVRVEPLEVAGGNRSRRARPAPVPACLAGESARLDRQHAAAVDRGAGARAARCPALDDLSGPGGPAALVAHGREASGLRRIQSEPPRPG